MLLKIILNLLIVSNVFAADKEFVHHPQPKDPIFLSEKLYPKLKDQIQLPPSANSVEQAADEKTLHDVQASRTQLQCTQAKNEVLVSLESFYGSPKGPLNSKQIKKLTPFFLQIRNDGDFYIQKMKKDFPRERPFIYIKGLNPCVAKEVTGAYPSGHATLSKLYALILVDLYPDKALELQKRSDEIAFHRVLSGMHHPSDIEAGKVLGNLIFTELKKSEKYNTEIKNLKIKEKGIL